MSTRFSCRTCGGTDVNDVHVNGTPAVLEGYCATCATVRDLRLLPPCSTCQGAGYLYGRVRCPDCAPGEARR